MSDIKVGKILLLLILGVFSFLYILANTVADIYYLSNPVIGVSMEVHEEPRQLRVVAVIPEGPADRAGIEIGDVITEIGGKSIESAADFADVVRTAEVGGEVSLKVTRQGQVLSLQVQIERRLKTYTKLVFLSLLPGVVFCYTLILIGTFVFLKKIEDRTARVFYLMVLFWALAMWDSFPFSLHTLEGVLPNWFHWITLTFWPMAVGLLLHFTLIFPVESKLFQRHRRRILGLAYFPLIFVLAFVYADLQDFSWRDTILRFGFALFFPVNFFLATNRLGCSAKRKDDPHKAKQAQIMLWGTNLSLVLPVGYYFMPRLLFDYSLPLADFALFLTVLWPITLAYVIIKHRFMEIDVIVKRGVAYALLSGFVIAIYFFLVIGLGQLILNLTGFRSQIVTIVATLFIAALFNPAKNRIRGFVDRRFYPSRFTYREAVRDFSRQLVSVVDLDRLFERVQTLLAETMRVQPLTILWRSTDEAYGIRQTTGSQDDGLRFSNSDVVIGVLQEKQRLVDLTPLWEQKVEIPEEEVSKWESLGTEIALPLLSKGELLGVISLGLKGDDEPYYKEDMDLLETLSDQINISLENAILTESLREQDRLKKELEVARRIQLHSLPQADPEISGLEVSGVSIPALEVGGDYYDYLEFADGRFGVVVGDVSGKGMFAALYMSQLKGVLKTASKFYQTLKELAVEVNAATFMSMEKKSFITLCLGAFDLNQKKFQMVRAGHLPILYYSAKEGLCKELTPKGIGVGLGDSKIFESELEEIEIDFDSGDIFLFYTDGIDEARNSKGEELGINTLNNLMQNNGHGTALDLRKKIIAEIDTSSGDTHQRDDMTLVVVRVE